MTMWRKGVLLLSAVGVAIQLIPVTRDNPPEIAPLPIDDPAVRLILQTSCFDCHSHRTRWPAYARVAPVSWLVAHDVHEGREKLNFSAWTTAAERQAHNYEEIVEVLEEGEMPLWIYTVAHPDARLNAAARTRLLTWARAGAAQRRNP